MLIKKNMLVSFIGKKKSGKKTMMAFTTMHDTVKVSNYQKKKPQIIFMYDHTKGGVDIIDLLLTSHSTWTKSKRWPLNALAFILNTVS